MSIEELVESAQAILKESGLKTDFLRGDDVAMHRYQALDRTIEIVVRSRGWTVSHVHVSSKKATRLKGADVAGLEKALRPLLEETAFEPAESDPSRFRR